MNNHPLLMQTLPNSGSSWFAELLARQMIGCRYYDMEFFNPIRNKKYRKILSRDFGCELPSCYRNIASEGDNQTHSDIRNTWGKERHTFTKEIYSPFKTDIYRQHFRCFVFVRTARESFPPSRLRVWSFYEHGWYAMAEAGHILKARTMEDRALEAHEVMRNRLLEDASDFDLPVIHYEDLFKDDRAAVKAISNAVGCDMPGLLDALRQTRRKIRRVIAA